MLVAAVVWGPTFRGDLGLFQCDNTTVVAAINSGSSRHGRLLPLLRALQFVAAPLIFALGRNTAGADNVFADALSRGADCT